MANERPVVSLDDYVRDAFHKGPPSLSASVAHILLTKSPRHARLAHPRLNPMWQAAESDAMDLGTIVHALLLEDDASRLIVIDAPDFRTKAAREARDAARATGGLPILAHNRRRVDDMIVAARQAIADAPEIKAAFSDGNPEITLHWEENGHWCRCRPDWVTSDHRLAIDLKTTSVSAEPDSWSRGQLLNMGYDLQAAFGLRAIRVLYGPRDVSFVFMVQDTEPPYAVSFSGLSPEFEAFAERKRLKALEMWAACLKSKEWPGYPQRICWAEPPPWAMTRWDEQHLMDESATVEAL